jgi:hypothetical protein
MDSWYNILCRRLLALNKEDPDAMFLPGSKVRDWIEMDKKSFREDFGLDPDLYILMNSGGTIEVGKSNEFVEVCVSVDVDDLDCIVLTHQYDTFPHVLNPKEEKCSEVGGLVERSVYNEVPPFSELHPFSYDPILVGGGRGNRRRNNRKERKKVPARAPRSRAIVPHQEPRVPRLLQGNSPFPPSRMFKLKYFEPNLVVQNAAASFIFKEWQLNSAYDFDPALGGGTFAGYTQIAAIYNQYHVKHVRFRFDVAGNEPTLPLTFGITMKDFRPSLTATTYALAQNCLELAPTTGPFTVGETTGNAVFRSRWYDFDPAIILGNSQQYNSDISYSSVVTTNPINLLWMAFVIFAPTTATFLPNGCVLTMYCELDVKFYSLSSDLV